MDRNAMGLAALVTTLAAFAVFAWLAQTARRPDAPATTGLRSRFPVWLRCIAAAAIISLASFLLMNLWLGGNALNGYSANGHYYLKHGNHYKETGQSAYAIRRTLGLSSCGLIMLTIFLAGFPSLRKT